MIAPRDRRRRRRRRRVVVVVVSELELEPVEPVAVGRGRPAARPPRAGDRRRRTCPVNDVSVMPAGRFARDVGPSSSATTRRSRAASASSTWSAAIWLSRSRIGCSAASSAATSRHLLRRPSARCDFALETLWCARNVTPPSSTTNAAAAATRSGCDLRAPRLRPRCAARAAAGR